MVILEVTVPVVLWDLMQGIVIISQAYLLAATENILNLILGGSERSQTSRRRHRLVKVASSIYVTLAVNKGGVCAATCAENTRDK